MRTTVYETHNKINYEFYKDSQSIPIEEVVDLLGLTKGTGSNKDKFICPCHNDTHPSAVLDRNGKYNNKFKCFSCGESGNPLMLTLAVKYGIKPSEYFAKIKNDDYSDFPKLMESALFLNKYYPGGVIVQDLKKNEKDLPDIPPKMLKKIGIQGNFLSSQYARPFKPPLLKELEKHGANLPNELEDVDISDIEKAYIILDKLNERIDRISTERRYIMQKFPALDDNAKAYIDATLKNESKEFNDYITVYEEYIDKYDETVFHEEDLTQDLEIE